MKCIKKPFDTEGKAKAAMDYHNAQATDKGWKIMKGVYYCEEHKAWHITSMKPSDVTARLKWIDGMKDIGSRVLDRRERIFDHYMNICQQKLLTPDGTYRRPTWEAHKKLMESLVGSNPWPVKFKYVEMWWLKLPSHKQYLVQTR